MSARRDKGFTVVELMVAVLAAGVLAITLSSLLFYAYKGWKAVRAYSEMERDGSLAMRTLSRVVREASSNDIMNVSSSDLIVSNVDNVVEHRFFQSGGSVVYTRGGASMDLVQAGVTEFFCSAVTSNNQITMILNLNEPTSEAEMSITNVVTLRN